MKRVYGVLRFLAVLYLFFLCIEMLGGAFKLFGKDAATSLLVVTDNPIIALMIGVLATSLMQSSSTTTSLIVGLVATGSLTIEQAIPMIMGANIGTTITNTIVSLGHVRDRDEFKKAFTGAVVHDCFNIMSVAILLPVELIFHPIQRMASGLSSLLVGVEGAAFHSPIKAVVKPIVVWLKGLGIDLLGSESLVGIILVVSAIGLLVLSLTSIVRIMKSALASRMKSLVQQHLFNGVLRPLLIGIGLTALVQSSSVTTSLAVPMLGAGLVDIRRVFPFMVGANIGTTVTAILASLVTGSPAALTIALCHLLFNLMGTALFLPLSWIPIRLAQQLGGWTAQRRWIAPAYVLGLFFALPGFLVLIS